MCQFDSLPALRKSVQSKAISLLKARPDLGETVKNKLTSLKKAATADIDKWNKDLQSRGVDTLLKRKKKDDKSKAKADKKKKRKERDGNDCEDEYFPSSAEDDSSSSSDSSGSSDSSTTLRLGEEPKNKKDKKKSGKKKCKKRKDKGKSRSSKDRESRSEKPSALDDSDLWKGKRFTPTPSPRGDERVSGVVSDELMEMLASPMQESFRHASESWLATSCSPVLPFNLTKSVCLICVGQSVF